MGCGYSHFKKYGYKNILGVDPAQNIAEIAKAGGDTFVAGSAIFGENNYQEIITKIRKKID